METPALDRLMHFVQDALNPRWGLDKQRRIDLDAVLPEAQRELEKLKQAAGKGDDGGGVDLKRKVAR